MHRYFKTLPRCFSLLSYITEKGHEALTTNNKSFSKILSLHAINILGSHLIVFINR